MNRKGLTIIELLVSFIIISIILIGIMNVTFAYRSDLATSNYKTELMEYKNNLTQDIYTDILNKKVKNVEQISPYVIRITFTDGEKKDIVVSDTSNVSGIREKSITYGGRIYKINEVLPTSDDDLKNKQSIILNNLNFTRDDLGNDVIYHIDINIYQVDTKKDYGIHLTFLQDTSEEIRLDPNGGTVVNSVIRMNYGDTFKDLEIPEYKGHNFLGWYTTNDINGILANKDKKYKEIKPSVLYARWDDGIYKLDINPNGGLYDNNINVKAEQIGYNQTYQLKEPTRKGYIFGGWEVNGEGSGVDNENKVFTMGVENTEIKAIWKADTYNLFINPDGGEYKGQTGTVTIKLKSNEKITLEEPVRDGYDFQGWEITSGEGSSFDENANTSTVLTMGVEETRIIAKWGNKNYNYKILHQKGRTLSSGTFQVEEVEEEQDVVEYGTKITPTLKTYEGFTTPASKTLTVTSNVEKNILELNYERNKYKLTINLNGGQIKERVDGVYQNITGNVVKDIYFDDKVSLKVPFNSGYTFTNWEITNGKLVIEDDTDDLGNKIIVTKYVMPSATSTIKALYEANDYVVTYNANGGAISTSNKTVTFGNDYGDLKEPTRSGYTFSGWYDSLTGGNLITSTTKVNISVNHTLYARWTPNNYTVTLDLDGGTASTSSISVTYDSTYSNLPTPTKQNYKFVGWFTDKTGGSEVNNVTSVKITQNQTLYARWILNQFTITFNANGGGATSSSGSKTVYSKLMYGEDLIPNNIFSLKSGTHFKGWNTASNASGKYVSVGTSLQNAGINGDTTLYAIWESHNYLIYSYTNAVCNTNWQSNDHVAGCKLYRESNVQSTSITLYNSALTSSSTVSYVYHRYCTWEDAPGCDACHAAQSGSVKGCSAADRWGTVYKKCSKCGATTVTTGAP